MNAKPATIKPPRALLSRRFVDDALDVLLVALALLGLAGTLYRVLKPGSWIPAFVTRLWASPLPVWLLGLGGAGAAVLGKRWLDRNPQRSESAHLLLYLATALGLYFLFRLLATGSF
ncbi:MAG TPA: hypothetical protein VMH32_25295 [Burkholderiales bacterium]|nr:hypothetical protein [Burkholderiales bacterium]